MFFILGELQHALDLSKPKFVFVSSIVVQKTVAVCKLLSYVKNVLLMDGKEIDLYLGGLIRKKQNEFNIEDYVSKSVNIHDQVALIFCSSGTTGQPKGVQITQENILACLQSYRGFVASLGKLQQRTAIVFNIAPWFHVLGFVSMFMYACSGQTVNVFIPKFDEALFYGTIEVRLELLSSCQSFAAHSMSLQKYKVNFMILVPPIMVMLAKSPLLNKYDLSSVTGE